MFQNKGHEFQMKSEGNKANGTLWDRGDGIHNLLFSWCHAACPAAQAGDVGPASGEKHRKGHCINTAEVNCLAMQSLMSQNRCFFGMMPLATAAGPVVVSHWA